MKEIGENVPDYTPSFSYEKLQEILMPNHAGLTFLMRKILENLKNLPDLLKNMVKFDYFKIIQKMHLKKLNSDLIRLWQTFAHFPHDKKVITDYNDNDASFIGNKKYKNKLLNQQYSFMTQLMNNLAKDAQYFENFAEFCYFPLENPQVNESHESSIQMGLLVDV